MSELDLEREPFGKSVVVFEQDRRGPWRLLAAGAAIPLVAFGAIVLGDVLGYAVAVVALILCPMLVVPAIAALARVPRRLPLCEHALLVEWSLRRDVVRAEHVRALAPQRHAFAHDPTMPAWQLDYTDASVDNAIGPAYRGAAVAPRVRSVTLRPMSPENVAALTAIAAALST